MSRHAVGVLTDAHVCHVEQPEHTEIGSAIAQQGLPFWDSLARTALVPVNAVGRSRHDATGDMVRLDAVVVLGELETRNRE